MTSTETPAVDTTHECPWPECTKRVERSQFACRTHWMALPTEHKTAILAGYRGGNRHDHAIAMRDAMEWMRGKRQVQKLDSVFHPVRGQQAPGPRDFGSGRQGSLCSGANCGKPIRWAETRTGKPIPLDIEPNARGPVVLEPREGKAPLAIVVGPPTLRAAQLDLLAPPVDEAPDTRTRYMPHHATCPDAPRFR